MTLAAYTLYGLTMLKKDMYDSLNNLRGIHENERVWEPTQVRATLPLRVAGTRIIPSR